jgi:hypothetical protein
MNRIHVNVGHAPTVEDCALIAQTVGDWWDDNVQAIVATNVVMREVYVKSIAVANGPEATYSAPFPLAGLLAGDSLPNNVSIAVSLRSGLTGRSARGRWFWYGITEGQVDANTMNVAAISIIDAAITNLREDIIGLGFQWVIVSYVANGAPRPGGPVYFIVTTITIVDSTVDSQRRRLPGRGR